MNRKQKIKFTTLFNALSDIEKVEFQEFINLSYINKGRNYKSILASIKLDKSGYLEFNQSENNRTRWNRISELGLLAEKFLAFKNMESDKFSFEMSLMRELRKRKLETYFELRFSKATRETIKKPLSNFKIKELYELNNLHLFHLGSIGNVEKYSTNFCKTTEYSMALFFFRVD